MRVFKHVLQLMAGFFLFCSVAQAQQGVCVYKDNHYEGPRRCFENNIRSFARLDMNDQISSFQIHGNVDVIFFEHHNYKGANKRFSGDQSVLFDGMNDNFSSMKIVESHKQRQWGNRGEWGSVDDDELNDEWNNVIIDDDIDYGGDEGGGNKDIYDENFGRVCLYSDKNYAGREYCFRDDDPRFENFGFDNKADSIRIEGNIEVELFQHSGYKGFSRIYRRSTPRFKPSERDQYSAIKIRKRGKNYDHLTAKACLFPDRNYGGQPYCFNSDIPRFADFGFDNMADSLRINGDYEIILYQHENYTGFSRVYRNNNPRFRGNNHDQFSSIKIRRR